MSTVRPSARVFSDEEIEAYAKSIEYDFGIARRHQRNGRYELVVTPQEPVVRRPDMATTVADISGFSCATARLLTTLYEQHGRKVGVEVKTTVEIPRTHVSEQRGIYMLHVLFIFKQETKRRRRFI